MFPIYSIDIQQSACYSFLSKKEVLIPINACLEMVKHLQAPVGRIGTIDGGS